MTLTIEAVLVLIIAVCLLRAGVLFERRRWIGFVRWQSRECESDGDFHDRMLGCATWVQARGWR